MTDAFAAGNSVICGYTHEGYDAETSLRSKQLFRIDQITLGSWVHVIRAPKRTLVWADGNAAAIEFATTDYDRTSAGAYPTFNPDDFDIVELFPDGTTCHVVESLDDALFSLPTAMASAPAN